MIDTKHESVAFFRHVPKTAGTSLITTLSNIFGDAHCHRFETVDHEFAATFGRVMNERQGSLALISGHVPLSVIAPGLAGSEFTVLREPIARVLSLRRFLERRPPAERARLGFGDSISIDELLASNAPEIYAQVRNGMTRFFSDAGGFNDPMTVEFWLVTPGNETFAAAADAAARMAIGTVEDMSGTLSALGQLLRVAYPLEVPVENATTDASEEEISPGEYRRPGGGERGRHRDLSCDSIPTDIDRGASAARVFGAVRHQDGLQSESGNDVSGGFHRRTAGIQRG